jgi:predicted Zn-dependent peptidase
LGAEFNAGTDKEYTNFYIKARSGVVEEAFDILSDMVLYPLIREEDTQREKGVILEEMAMYEDTPIRRIGEIFENLIFEGGSLGWDVIGTKKAIKKVKRDDFIRYRKTHYYTENMLITVAGGVTEEEVVKLVKKYFAGLEKKGIKPKKPKTAFKQTKPKLLIQTKKTDQAHIIIGFRGYPYGDRSEYAESVLAGILGGGMSSRMFTEVREKRGLAYAVKTSDNHYMDNGYFGTYAGLDIKRVEEAVKVILDQYYGIASGKYEITTDELVKAKEYIKGHLALALEDTKMVNAFFAFDELFLGRTKTPKELYKAIDMVSMQDVMKVAKNLFVPEKLNMAAIGPLKSKENIENLLK